MSNVNSLSGIDDGQLRHFFIDSSTLNSNARLEHHTVNSSLPDASDAHGGFWVESSAPPHSEATSHEISHVHVDGIDLQFDTTSAYGTNSFGAQTVDFYQQSADTGSSSQLELAWQANSSQNSQPSNWDSAPTNCDTADQTGHSLVIAGSVPITPDLGTVVGDGVALAPHLTTGTLAGCCPGCWRWMLAEAQGQSLPTLPSGIVLLGDAGATSASLMQADSAALSGTGAASGSLQSVAGGTQSTGLNINIIWDSSVANAPAAFKSVVESVVQFYESEFSNPVTLNINVGWGEVGGSPLGSSDLGESESFLEPFSYSQIVSALTQNASSMPK